MSAAAEQKEEVLADIASTVEVLRAELVSKDHRTALTALLSLFVELAVANPCCTKGCANSAMSVAMELSMRASAQRPQGTPLH